MKTNLKSLLGKRVVGMTMAGERCGKHGVIAGWSTGREQYARVEFDDGAVEYLLLTAIRFEVGSLG